MNDLQQGSSGPELSTSDRQEICSCFMKRGFNASPTSIESSQCA